MITFDEIKTLASQLTRADKLRLMDDLAAQVGQAVPGDDLAALPPRRANATCKTFVRSKCNIAPFYVALGRQKAGISPEIPAFWFTSRYRQCGKMALGWCQ